jgi:hypothetical protein
VYLGKKELAEKILSEEEETTLETDMNTKQNKEAKLNNWNSGELLNNEKDIQDIKPKTTYNCKVTSNPVKGKKVIGKVCSMCHRQSRDTTNVKYECLCTKRVCMTCFHSLPRASTDYCPIHPSESRIDLKELRERLRYVPYEM